MLTATTSHPSSGCAFQQRPARQWLTPWQVWVGTQSSKEHSLQEETQLFVISLELKDWDKGVPEKSDFKKLKGLIGELTLDWR